MNKTFTYLFLFLPFLTFAQSNYKNGVVIKNNGQALQGYIDYREWSNSPKYFSFKTSELKPTNRFSPDSVKSFEVIGLESYITYSGKVSMNPIALPDIPTYLDTTSIYNTVFLKLIAQGENISLYTNIDNVKTRYFIKENNNEAVELNFYNYLDGSQEIQKTPYKNRLFAVALKYGKENPVINILNKGRYDVATLTKVINVINNKTTSSKSKVFIRYFAGIALNKSDTKFTGDNLFSSIKATNYLPKVSIGADFIGNKTVQKTIFRGELCFSALTPEFTKTVTYAGITGSETYTFSQYTASVVPQFIYNIYNKQNFKVYIDAGLSINVSKYANSKVTKTDNAYFIPTSPEYRFEPLWFSFPIKAGVALNKRFELYASYAYPSTCSNYIYFNVKTQSLSLGANIYLSKK